MTFLGIVACQVGRCSPRGPTALTAQRSASLTNRLLSRAIAFELAFSAALIFGAGAAGVFGTAHRPGRPLLVAPAFPLVVWAADESATPRADVTLRRVVMERRGR